MIQENQFFWAIKFFKMNEGDGIGEADVIVYPGVFGNMGAKLYLHLKLEVKDTMVEGLPLQMRQGRGLEGLPEDEKVEYVRVLPPGQPRFVEGSLPALHLHGCDVKEGLTVLLRPQWFSYKEFMAPAKGYFDEESKLYLAHYLDKLRRSYNPGLVASETLAAEKMEHVKWSIKESVGDFDVYMKEKGRQTALEDQTEFRVCEAGSHQELSKTHGNHSGYKEHDLVRNTENTEEVGIVPWDDTLYPSTPPSVDDSTSESDAVSPTADHTSASNDSASGGAENTGTQKYNVSLPQTSTAQAGATLNPSYPGTSYVRGMFNNLNHEEKVEEVRSNRKAKTEQARAYAQSPRDHHNSRLPGTSDVRPGRSARSPDRRSMSTFANAGVYQDSDIPQAQAALPGLDYGDDGQKPRAMPRRKRSPSTRGGSGRPPTKFGRMKLWK